MINLIPKEEKKRMIADFHYRVLVLFLMVIDTAVLIAIVAVLPSYFLVTVKNSIANGNLEAQQREPVASLDQRTLGLIRDLNKKIEIVENAEAGRFLPSLKIVSEVLSRKRQDVKITQISYDNTPNGGKKISISGFAPSREVLLLFRQALESDTNFKKVDLPISNFVKGSNILFYLTLVPA